MYTYMPSILFPWSCFPEGDGCLLVSCTHLLNKGEYGNKSVVITTQVAGCSIIGLIWKLSELCVLASK